MSPLVLMPAMPELLLLRHAKSSWDDPALDDFDRPLSARGRAAAPAMGGEMARRGWVPDAALVSPALRTRRTWELAAAELPHTVAAGFPSALYESGPRRMLSVLHGADPAVTRLVLVGHNPGMEELALDLAATDSDAGALRRMARKFPTAALARFVFDGEWAGLAAAGARLTHFLTPAELE